MDVIRRYQRRVKRISATSIGQNVIKYPIVYDGIKHFFLKSDIHREQKIGLCRHPSERESALGIPALLPKLDHKKELLVRDKGIDGIKKGTLEYSNLPQDCLFRFTFSLFFGYCNGLQLSILPSV
jgi:hypothetical protein